LKKDHKRIVPIFAQFRALFEISASEFEGNDFLAPDNYCGKLQFAGLFCHSRYYAIVNVRVLLYSHRTMASFPALKDGKHVQI
jgi:hypothetical protein